MRYLLKKQVFKPLSFSLIFVLLYLSILPAFSFAQQKVEVPAGLGIILRVAETVTPSTHPVGSKVTLKVVSDVKVKGVTVIKAGANAFGNVVVSKKASFLGRPGEIFCELRFVEAVDGTLIPLSGNFNAKGEDKLAVTVALSLLLCLLFGLMKGGDAVIPAQTMVNGIITSSVEVGVEEF